MEKKFFKKIYGMLFIIFVSSNQLLSMQNITRRLGIQAQSLLHKQLTSFITPKAYMPAHTDFSTYGYDDNKQRQSFYDFSIFGPNALLLAGLVLVKKQKAQNEQQAMHTATLWKFVARNYKITQDQKQELFAYDCSIEAIQNTIIPQKDTSKIRIVTYNVHYWTNVFKQNSFSEIVKVLATIDADVIVLQEVSLGATKHCDKTSAQILEAFRELGYCHGGHDTFSKAADHWGAPFGNLILSKYPFTKKPCLKYFKANKGGKWHFEKRCFTNVTILLPNTKTISLYGTHLEVQDATEQIRQNQVGELIQNAYIDSNNNVLIVGDFNAVKEQDYKYKVNGVSVWEMVKHENKLRHLPTPTRALAMFERHNYKDSFVYSGFKAPKYTAWSGTRVDYMMLKSTWDLLIDGCYVYYTAASDHLPVIMDIALDK